MTTAINTTRTCEACGADCKGKKVWEKLGKRIICMACGSRYTFDANNALIEREQLPTFTTAKRIEYNHFDRDYSAFFDNEFIGAYPTHHAAEVALNDHALYLAEQGLTDAPLAALAESSLRAACELPSADDTDEIGPDGPTPNDDVPNPMDYDKRCDNCGGVHHIQRCPAIWQALRPLPRTYTALIRAASTILPQPRPDDEEQRLRRLANEAFCTCTILNRMIDTMVIERDRHPILSDTPARELCDRLYRIHSKAHNRYMRQNTALLAFLIEHRCASDGCLQTGKHACSSAWYCERHFAELAVLAEMVET